MSQKKKCITRYNLQNLGCNIIHNVSKQIQALVRNHYQNSQSEKWQNLLNLFYVLPHNETNFCCGLPLVLRPQTNKRARQRAGALWQYKLVLVWKMPQTREQSNLQLVCNQTIDQYHNMWCRILLVVISNIFKTTGTKKKVKKKEKIKHATLFQESKLIILYLNNVNKENKAFQTIQTKPLWLCYKVKIKSKHKCMHYTKGRSLQQASQLFSKVWSQKKKTPNAQHRATKTSQSTEERLSHVAVTLMIPLKTSSLVYEQKVWYHNTTARGRAVISPWCNSRWWNDACRFDSDTLARPRGWERLASWGEGWWVFCVSPGCLSIPLAWQWQ